MNLSQLERSYVLRGIAAIGIAFFFHYVHFKPASMPFDKEPMNWLYANGWILGDLFFISSCIIMAFLYQGVIQSQKSALVDFFKIRLARLCPAYLLTLFIVLVRQAIPHMVSSRSSIFSAIAGISV